MAGGIAVKTMNRVAVIIAICLVAQTAFNQAVVPHRKAFRVVAAGAQCSQQSLEPQNDLWIFAADGNLSQKIKVASACSVTTVDIYCVRSAGVANATIAFYTAVNKGGSKIGSDSQTAAIGSSFAWVRFTFSTPVSLTADAFLTIESMSAGDLHWGANTSQNNYENTNYDAFTGTTDQNQDFLFKMNPSP